MAEAVSNSGFKTRTPLTNRPITPADGLPRLSILDRQRNQRLFYVPESEDIKETKKRAGSARRGSLAPLDLRPGTSASSPIGNRGDEALPPRPYSSDRDPATPPSVGRLPPEIRKFLEHQSPLTSCAGEPKEDSEAMLSDLDTFLEQKGYYNKKKWRGRIPVLRSLYLGLHSGFPRLSVKIAVICLSMGIRGENVRSLLSFLTSLDYSGAGLSSDVRARLTGALLELLEGCDWREEEDLRTSSAVLRLAIHPAGPLLLDKPTCLHVLPFLHSALDAGTNPKLIGQDRRELVALVTELLRRLLDKGHEVRKAILRQRLPSRLPLLLAVHRDSRPILRNISRITSKMSSSSYLGDLFDQKDGSAALATALGAFPKDEDITTRLLFTLGNTCFLMGQEASEAVLEAPQFIPTLLDLFSSSLEVSEKRKEGNESESTPSEVLLKVTITRRLKAFIFISEQVVFVVGNLAANSTIGPVLAENSKFPDLLVSSLIIGLTSPRSDELIMNSLLAIHNISFYSDHQSGSEHESSRTKQLLRIAYGVKPVLMEEEVSWVVEACNIMGNLSRARAVRKWMLEQKLEVMAGSLLASSSRELAKSGVGVLLNLSADEESAAALLPLQIPKKTISLLKKHEGDCWNLCSLGCKLLHNYTLFHSIEEDDASELSVWIVSATDDGLHNSSKHTDSRRSSNGAWEDFCSVAIRLLQKISSSYPFLLDEITIT